MKDLPSTDYVRSVLDYEPETGRLVWGYRETAAPGWNKKYAGIEAGHRRPRFIAVRLNPFGVFLAHRLVWLLVHGNWPKQINHINGDAYDNRLANLREATQSENSCNRGAQSNSKSGIKGVCFCTRTGRWLAQIAVARKNRSLGQFDTVEEAARAYAAAAAQLHGDFARTS